jgi:hypothetical protein
MALGLSPYASDLSLPSPLFSSAVKGQFVTAEEVTIKVTWPDDQKMKGPNNIGKIITAQGSYFKGNVV